MILFFAGRDHHREKLAPLFERMKAQGLSPVWLISKNAVNIDSSLETALKSDDDFVHAYTLLGEGDDVKIDKIVKAISAKARMVPGVSPFWFYYSIRELAQVHVAFGNLLDRNKVDAVVALHSNNFWAKNLLYQAQKRAIKTYTFQEGLLRDRDQETLGKQKAAADYVDTIFAWNKGSKVQYINAGVAKSTIDVSTPMHLDKYFSISQEDALRNVGSVPWLVFAPTLAEEYVGNISVDAQNLATTAAVYGLNYFFQPHPFEKGMYGDLETSLPIDKLLLARSGNAIFVGQHSTIMHEALVLGAMVIEYQADGLPILQPLSQLGVAISADKTNFLDVIGEILSFGETAEKTLKKARQYIKNEYGDALGNGTAYVANAIKSGIKND